MTVQHRCLKNTVYIHWAASSADAAAFVYISSTPSPSLPPSPRARTPFPSHCSSGRGKGWGWRGVIALCNTHESFLLVLWCGVMSCYTLCANALLASFWSVPNATAALLVVYISASICLSRVGGGHVARLGSESCHVTP